MTEARGVMPRASSRPVSIHLATGVRIGQTAC